MKKLFWHLKFWLFFFASKVVYVDSIIKRVKMSDFEIERTNYYCKIESNFILSEFITPPELVLSRSSGYSYDMFRMTVGLDESIHFSVLYGDVTHVPKEPTFVKSRPISINNENSVLLPLDTFRHLVFVDDQVQYEDKIPKIVWRGAAYRDLRKSFLAAAINLDCCDVRDTSRHAEGGGRANWLTKEQQLKYKFIFSVEGNDVATNLKWIMSSNSLCFMLKPKYETWFMEGTLIPDFHYVLIDDDFSNIKAKYDFYLSHPDEALKIIKQAQAYVEPFKDVDRQFALGRHVIQRYASHVLN